MNVRHSKRYFRDFDSLLTYVAQDDDSVAEAMARSIRDAIARCAVQPLIGVATDIHNVFRYPIKKYRLTLFYRVRPRKNEIEVLRVVRGKRVKKLGVVP